MKKSIPLIILIMVVFITGTLWAGGNDADVKAIQKTMDKQLVEWNKGNVDGFMAGYWKSEKFTFQSGNKRLLGYQQLAAMYKKNYAGTKMGTLTFKDLEFKHLAKDLYMVMGRWNVKTQATKDNEKEGLFTLLFRKIDGSWKIIHDHSS